MSELCCVGLLVSGYLFVMYSIVVMYLYLCGCYGVLCVTACWICCVCYLCCACGVCVAKCGVCLYVLLFCWLLCALCFVMFCG